MRKQPSFATKAVAIKWLLLLACGGAAGADDLSDPTRPSGFTATGSTASAPAAQALALTFIRLGSAPLAVINGTSLSPGQSVAGHRLLALRANSATLADSDGTLVLTLSPSLQKSPAIPKP